MSLAMATKHRITYDRIYKDYTGRQLADWTVLGPGGRNSADQRMWKCRCKCGTLREITGSRLAALAKHGVVHLVKNGKRSISRGRCSACSRPDARFNRRRGPAQLAFTKMKHGAIVRNLEVAITKDDLIPLLEAQDHKCALTGIPLTMTPMRKEEGKHNASLDRIDSSKGYTLDNIQWVDKRINLIKMDLPEDEFISLCCAVADYQRQKTSKLLAA